MDQFLRCLLCTQMEILNRQLDIVSGVLQATSRFIDSLGTQQDPAVVHGYDLIQQKDRKHYQQERRCMEQSLENTRSNIPNRESTPSGVAQNMLNSSSSKL